ncbi:DUF1385 domain-containing protein [Longirhabdus pacifica]|uniref:DUF1385 domain-containing protein n=1 Tax=Longirhabdus pacifica TaxID=2305227 RepID=UPI001F0C74EA|nr:DUF1385 domain-containing protein [Longirhabdus pacifica]
MSQDNKVGVYGGLAVMEGVMFAGQTTNVTAVRRKSNQEIEFFEVPKTETKWLTMLKKIPFIRGIAALIEASGKGANHLNFSAEVYAEEEGEEIEKPSRLTMILGVALVGVLSFLMGKVIFTLVPAALEYILFERFFDGFFLHNIIEGLIKIIILFGYLYVISLTPLIKRLFQYHGAEHKVISCYEAGLDLTVKNVQKFSTLHYRCGSSFMVFTVIVGVFVYAAYPVLMGYESITLWEKLLQRLFLLPVVIGVSFEVLRFTNSLREVPVLKYLGYPGLWLQKLTTKQPTDDQVEVSIASFKRVLELDARK